MNPYENAIACLTEAEKRHETLNIIFTERDYSDVVRQSASIVHLSVKSLLQFAGVEVNGNPDLMPLIDESATRLPQLGRQSVRRLRQIYRHMSVKKKKTRGRAKGGNGRRPTFSREEAVRAMEWSDFMVLTAQRIIKDHDD